MLAQRGGLSWLKFLRITLWSQSMWALPKFACWLLMFLIKIMLRFWEWAKLLRMVLRKGVVVDIQKTISSIKAAVKEAELMADVTINTAAVGISGGHIQSTNSHGMVAIKQGEVKDSDVANVMNAARAFAIPEGMQILHVMPQFYVIDTREKVQNPVGMHGIRLEVQAHVIMGAIASVQNLVKCCEMAGVKVTDIILEQLASAQAVLSDDEREIGVAMLDIGGGTSDLAIYQNGNIRHTYVLPVAGNHFTNDVAVGLRTTIKDAERVKKEYGLPVLIYWSMIRLLKCKRLTVMKRRLVNHIRSDCNYCNHERKNY